MLGALWFLLQLGCVATVVIWMSRHPGTVDVTWLGYEVQLSLGFLVSVLVVVGVFWTLLYRIWRNFVAVPMVYRRYKQTKQRELGYRAVTEGMVAVAAGDATRALKHARRAQKMIPDVPLVKLLSAQTYLAGGDKERAKAAFTELLEEGNAAIFGLKGLLQEAVQEGRDAEALHFVRKIFALEPKRDWVLKTLFELEIKNHVWRAADKTLARAEKAGVYSREDALHKRQAIYLAESDDAFTQGDIASAVKLAQRAFSFGYGMTPAALRLVRLYHQQQKPTAAQKVLKQAWYACPHPEIGESWMKLMPVQKAKNLQEQGKNIIRWAKKLADTNPEHRESQRLLGMAALEGKQWVEARAALLRAEDYRLLAKLEKEQSGNDAKAREWLEAAADLPPEPKWVCHACGHTALDWNPFCRNCVSFDCYDWVTPMVDVRKIQGA